MLSMVKMLLKGKVGGRALNSHRNYIVDLGKSRISWNCVLEFLWEPCHAYIPSGARGLTVGPSLPPLPIKQHSSIFQPYKLTVHDFSKIIYPLLKTV